MRLALRLLAWLVGALAAAVALILLTSWVGSSIPRNPGWVEPDEGIEIMVGTNGVHTELVLPLVTPVKDWRADLPVTDIPASGEAYTHFAVGWGEREVFLNTPTWADLRPGAALRALVGGDALLHVSHYVRPAPDADFRPLRVTPAQYARLAKAVEAAIVAPELRRKYRGYFDNDVFYEAPGRYTWRRTCNQWTSDMLAAAGVRTGWWTPFAGGVMKWVPRPPSRDARTARPASTIPPSGEAAGP